MQMQGDVRFLFLIDIFFEPSLLRIMMKRICLLLLVLGLAFLNRLQAQQTDSDPVPAHDSFTIYATTIGELRTINVWAPPEYYISNEALPVMYMADGGIVGEDFPHVAHTMAEMIAAKEIPPMLLVGIQNTQRRRDLTGPTEVKKDKEIAPVVGGSAAFRAFIKDELIPDIQRRYRTTDKKGILGESLSGLFVMETFFLTPELFDYYIAFDPSLWWNRHYLVNTASERIQKLPSKEIRLWFAGSATKDIARYTKALAHTLKKQPNKHLIWHYEDYPQESHATIFRAAKRKALLKTLGATTHN